MILKKQKLHWTKELKMQNAMLQDKLIVLVTKPDSLEAEMIKQEIEFKLSQEKAFWYGER